MRLHRRHVSLRLLKEDVLQGHVGGGVGGHVGQRANDRKQPTALALHEGRDRCRREPEGNVGLLGGELGSRRIRAGGGRRPEPRALGVSGAGAHKRGYGQRSAAISETRARAAERTAAVDDEGAGSASAVLIAVSASSMFWSAWDARGAGRKTRC
eukprot:5936748-Prymnesium_polylepis.1